jgi:hypothetical protein
LELVEPEGREAELDAFFAAIPVNLRHQGCEAYYEPTADRVTMPPVSLFSGFDHYYATLAHELSHNAVTRIMPHGGAWEVIRWNVGTFSATDAVRSLLPHPAWLRALLL